MFCDTLENDKSQFRSPRNHHHHQGGGVGGGKIQKKENREIIGNYRHGSYNVVDIIPIGFSFLQCYAVNSKRTSRIIFMDMEKLRKKHQEPDRLFDHQQMIWKQQFCPQKYTQVLTVEVTISQLN